MSEDDVGFKGHPLFIHPKYDDEPLKQNEKVRKNLAKDVQKFLDKGGYIQKIDFGESMLDPKTGVPKSRLSRLRKLEAEARIQGKVRGSGIGTFNGMDKNIEGYEDDE